MSRDPILVPPTIDLRHFVDEYVYPHHRKFFPVGEAGHVAAWVKRTPEITLARFDQRYLTLALHAGATDPGGSGWRYGPAVGALERRRLVAAFNGGFRLNTDAGGFVEDGRVGRPLAFGDASAVTYSDGTTDVGAWRQGGEGTLLPDRPASARQTEPPAERGLPVRR